jgi:uncharacterized protein (TIGR04141 family)
LMNLQVSDLKKHKIAAYDINQTYPMRRWSLYSALIGSVSLEGELYALNEGRWYKIDADYKKRADQEFASAKVDLDNDLGTFITKITGEGKRAKQGYESEEDYNKRIGNSTNLICLDRKLIKIDGVPGPGVEACDLLDLDGCRFIHVKKSRKSSSVLSHLFKQGTNSAQLFRSSSDFRQKVAAKIEQLSNRDRRIQFERAIATSKKWTVEYRIADHADKSGIFNIPFFSRLSFSDEKQRLNRMNFETKIGFINLNRVG